MCRDFLATFAVVLVTGTVLAERIPAAAPPFLLSRSHKPVDDQTAMAQEPFVGPPAPTSDDTAADERPLYWVGADYLMWWSKRSPLPVPLVTSSTAPGYLLAGTLGQNDTTILLGGKGIANPGQSGVGFVLGGWLNDRELLGLEARGFLLSRKSVSLTLPDRGGTYPLYIPWLDARNPSQEGTFIISDPALGYSGSVTLASSTRLWGLESNALSNLLSRDRFNLVVLAGFRYLDLQERLQLSAVTNDFVVDDRIFIQDQFSTYNQFFGGQIGARAEYRFGVLKADLTSKLAMGASRDVLTTFGSSQESGLGAINPGSHLGGIFAQPSNMGRQTNTSLAFIPQVGVNVGIHLVEAVQFKVGYDFLYWSNVVRPGDQVDRTINPTQVLGQQAIGPARPLPQFNRSDFSAHGLNVGLLFLF